MSRRNSSSSISTDINLKNRSRSNSFSSISSTKTPRPTSSSSSSSSVSSSSSLFLHDYYTIVNSPSKVTDQSIQTIDTSLPTLTIRPSIYPTIPPSIYISYPKNLNLERKDRKKIINKKNKKLIYKTYWRRGCVVNALKSNGYRQSQIANTHNNLGKDIQLVKNNNNLEEEMDEDDDKELDNDGIKVNNKGKWTVQWSKHPTSSQFLSLNCLQKVNHFPNSWCIGRKDRLSQTLTAMRRIQSTNSISTKDDNNNNKSFDEEYNFHPHTYVLPRQRETLSRTIKLEQLQKNSSSKTLWIVKPLASSCGRGINVMNTEKLIKYLDLFDEEYKKISKNSIKKKSSWRKKYQEKKILVQQYLSNPLLINDKKFDLRIYVLVTGVDPLRVYVYEEGLTRISTSNYSLKNLSNRFAHLTNYSINKKAENFKAAEFIIKNDNDKGDEEGDEGTENQPDNDPENEGDGGDDDDDDEEDNELDENLIENNVDSEMEGFKWSLSAFKKWLISNFGEKRAEETFDRIYDICIKTIIAAEGEITPNLQRSIKYRTNCYELFGCDIILDDNLNPYLLEVNVSPSLASSSPLDHRIKGMLMADVFHTVGVFPHDNNLIKMFTIENSNDLNYSSSNTSINSKVTDKNDKKNKNTIDRNNDGNPLGFLNLTKILSYQENYRKKPSISSIDLEILSKNTDKIVSKNSCCWWQLLLQIEDEIERSKSSKFKILYPKLNNIHYYLNLFRNTRFSDHLLAKWIELGGIKGKAFQYLPPHVKMLLINSSGGVFINPLSLTPSTPSNVSKKLDRPSSCNKLRKHSETEKEENIIKSTSISHPNRFNYVVSEDVSTSSMSSSVSSSSLDDVNLTSEPHNSPRILHPNPPSFPNPDGIGSIGVGYFPRISQDFDTSESNSIENNLKNLKPLSARVVSPSPSTSSGESKIPSSSRLPSRNRQILVNELTFVKPKSSSSLIRRSNKLSSHPNAEIISAINGNSFTQVNSSQNQFVKGRIVHKKVLSHEFENYTSSDNYHLISQIQPNFAPQGNHIKQDNRRFKSIPFLK